MAVVIEIENLGKCYTLGGTDQTYGNLREDLTRLLRRPLARLSRRPSRDFWALRGLSLSVEQGEVLGVVGRNGAGKSTLLKILSRITPPTEGRARLHGRVGSLLEVGTGFHPELTGRENIFLSGALLGMTRLEIRQAFDGIVSFAELDSFLDTPVKHYSSGMYVRLGFAVAAHLETEILIVDEVLAVGDAVFQKKCLGKIGEVSRSGRTVLFVSHNMTAVERLCHSAVYLDRGALVERGPAADVVSSYLRRSSLECAEQVWDHEKAPGNEKVRLQRVALETRGEAISMGTPFEVSVSYWNLKEGQALDVALHFCTDRGQIAFASGTARLAGTPRTRGLYRAVCQVPGNLLNSCTYKVNLLVVRDRSTVIYQMDDALTFQVKEGGDTRGEWHGARPGVVRPLLQWTRDQVEEEFRHEVRQQVCQEGEQP